jgi:hypothetical protein
MNYKPFLFAAVGAAALAMDTDPVRATPLSGAALAQKAATAEDTALQHVVWVRRCWRGYDGYSHCRRVWRDGGYYDDGYYYGPGVGFFFGGGRGHHGHHGHHR